MVGLLLVRNSYASRQLSGRHLDHNTSAGQYYDLKLC